MPIVPEPPPNGDGLDHEVSAREVVELGGRADPRQRGVTVLLRELAAHHGIAKPKCEVSGNAEALRDSFSCKPLDDVVSYSDSLDHDDFSIARLRQPSRLRSCFKTCSRGQ